jgi:hypothetical protein
MDNMKSKNGLRITRIRSLTYLNFSSLGPLPEGIPRTPDTPPSVR